MLVGIYMPAGTVQRGALPPVDGLEIYFLRHAIQGIAGSKTNTDTQFVWFYEEGEEPPLHEVPCEAIRRPASLFTLSHGNAPTLEEAVVNRQVDVLLTRIDAPQPLPRNVPKVLFVLDMYFQGEAQIVRTPAPPLHRKIKQACNEAKSILCPSEYVHKTCSSRLGMGLEKAVVARPGVNPVFKEPQGSIIDGPFALYVLNRYTESGIPTLLNAIEKNRELFPPTLVVLGNVRGKEPDDWGIPVVRIERCPDAMTASLMQHARMCIYLTKGEGSGMTVLQAMTAGAMLVTTKLGANFEVAGMVPFYCEPDNSYSLLQVLHRMLDESPKEREKRRQMAHSLIVDLTWERCGTKVVSALKRSQL